MTGCVAAYRSDERASPPWYANTTLSSVALSFASLRRHLGAPIHRCSGMTLVRHALIVTTERTNEPLRGVENVRAPVERREGRRSIPKGFEGAKPLGVIAETAASSIAALLKGRFGRNEAA
jgi:hypothetical protein